MFDFLMRFIYSPVNGYHGGKSCSSFSSCFFHRFVTELEARSQFSHENSIEHHICGGFNFHCPQVFLMFSCKFLGFFLTFSPKLLGSSHSKPKPPERGHCLGRSAGPRLGWEPRCICAPRHLPRVARGGREAGKELSAGAGGGGGGAADADDDDDVCFHC